MNKQIKPEQLALEPPQENKPALEAEVKYAVAHASALLAQAANADDFDWDDPDNESVDLANRVREGRLCGDRQVPEYGYRKA